MPRALIIAPHGSYRIAPFIDSARRAGLDVLVAAPGEHSIVADYAQGLHVDLHDPAAAMQRIMADAAAAGPYRAVIGTDDVSIELAARVSTRLGLPHNDPEAARLSRRKDLARARLAAAGVAVPNHRCLDLDQPLPPQIEDLSYPCVVKPVGLSASRGVIRADDTSQLLAAAARIEVILRDLHDLQERRRLLVEEFIPGFEVALEAILWHGRLQSLALFDKPDPLDGPFFEETYYVTPSRLAADLQQRIVATVESACAAYGLREGPVHAECRINARGVWVLEVAARSIGGLCGRLLEWGTGWRLEDLIVRHALGQSPGAVQASAAAGVLMIPIPEAGILRRVEGIGRAQRVPLVEEVVIHLREGYELVPLPEGASYLGFIFARGPDPEAVEAALRAAHAELRIVVAPLWQATVSA
jgi:biotin carboxylase